MELGSNHRKWLGHWLPGDVYPKGEDCLGNTCFFNLQKQYIGIDKKSRFLLQLFLEIFNKMKSIQGDFNEDDSDEDDSDEDDSDEDDSDEEETKKSKKLSLSTILDKFSHVKTVLEAVQYASSVTTHSLGYLFPSITQDDVFTDKDGNVCSISDGTIILPVSVPQRNVQVSNNRSSATPSSQKECSISSTSKDEVPNESTRPINNTGKFISDVELHGLDITDNFKQANHNAAGLPSEIKVPLDIDGDSNMIKKKREACHGNKNTTQAKAGCSVVTIQPAPSAITSLTCSHGLDRYPEINITDMDVNGTNMTYLCSNMNYDPPVMVEVVRRSCERNTSSTKKRSTTQSRKRRYKKYFEQLIQKMDIQFVMGDNYNVGIECLSTGKRLCGNVRLVTIEKRDVADMNNEEINKHTHGSTLLTAADVDSFFRWRISLQSSQADAYVPTQMLRDMAKRFGSIESPYLKIPIVQSDFSSSNTNKRKFDNSSSQVSSKPRKR